MELEALDCDLTVCKVSDPKDVDTGMGFFFLARTDDEISLVCPTKDVPGSAVQREDDWKCFRICGTLDFSLIGILSKISAVLADNGIGIFAVSTYDTDYILVKSGNFGRAEKVLEENGYRIRHPRSA